MPREKRTTAPNGDSKPMKPSPAVLLVVLLATMISGLVCLLGFQACGLPPPESVPIETKKSKFWKKKEAPPVEETKSPLCQKVVWPVLEHVLPRPPLERPAKQHAKECEAKEQKKKKNPIQKFTSLFKRRKQPAASHAELKSAFAQEVGMTKSQQDIAKRLAVQFREEVQDPMLDLRLAAVAWGGPGGPRWWHVGSGVDGGQLLQRYLRIMKWPKDLKTNFPFKLCSKGCDASFAIAHSLEWREKYKPWLMSPSAIKENADGVAYMRGHSLSLKGDNTGNAIVWVRAGAKQNGVTDAVFYFRAILNALDMAVADTLHRSHQKIGKFNVVVDADGASFGTLPKLGDSKKAISMLQDHFPDLLGMVMLANLSKPAEFLLNMIKPLITKEVRDKLLILPSDPVKRHAMLEAVVEPEFIPDYLGGTDTYRFDSEAYYHNKRLICTDQEGKEYLQTMPLHA